MTIGRQTWRREHYSLALSLLFHLALFLLLSRLPQPAREAEPRRQTVIILSQAAPAEPLPLGAETRGSPLADSATAVTTAESTAVFRSLPAGQPGPVSAAAIPAPLPAAARAAPVPVAALPRAPSAAIGGPRVPAAAGPAERPADFPEAPSLPEAPAAFPLPPMDEVLAGLSPREVSPPAASGAAAEAAGGESAAPVASAPAPSPVIGWQDQDRRVLRRGIPVFPDQLIREGLEADVSARFTVSPAGEVTDVQIVRSSGSTLVDHSVVQALREYAFAPAERSDTGTILFRFRLERSHE